MIPTIFEEVEARGEARGMAIGEARGKVLTILETRFKKVPKRVENTILQMNDTIALNSWAEHAATCQSMGEFEKALGK